MKKLAVLILGIAGLSAFAGTCVVKNTKLSEVNGDPVLSGEIRNETDADFLAHKILVAFLDDNNNVLQTKSVDGCLRSLQSGTSDFFAATSNEDPADVDKTLQRLDFAGLKVGQTVDGDLNFENDMKITRNGDKLVVTGTITNDDSDDLGDVRVCAVMRDNDGAVLNVVRDDVSDLDSDESGAYSVTVNVEDGSDVETVDLWADAINVDKDDAPTNPVSDLDNSSIGGCSTSTPTPTGTLPATNTPTNTPGAGTATATPTKTPVADAC